MTKENTVKKNNLLLKVPLELIISILVMLVASILVMVVAHLTVKKVSLEGDPVITEIYGTYTKEADESFAAGEIILEKYTITGETKSGVSYVGAKEHSFDPGYPVSGTIKIEFYISDDGIILGYQFLQYSHSAGNWKAKVTEYLDSFVGTQTVDILATMAANKGLYAGATETAGNAVDPILVALEAEVNK
ncbi:MAG: hypothetical protein ACOX56_06575 [Acholeplasmataceae bacterium]|jgi:hypothetical protein